MMTTPLTEFNYSDTLLDLDSPMFHMVNPSDICPMEVLGENRAQNVTVNPHNQAPYNYTCTNLTSSNCLVASPFLTSQNQALTTYQPQQQFNMYAQPQQENQQMYVTQTQYVPTNLTSERNHITTYAEPPPILSTQDDEPRRKLQEHLQNYRLFSQQRPERLRAQMAKEPPVSPSKLLRKSSGKKLTGRERQVELEKEEAHQLKLRKEYRAKICQLELKCNKLRQILVNIVAQSPDFNDQMMTFLEESELLNDQPGSSTSMAIDQKPIAFTIPNTSDPFDNTSRRNDAIYRQY